MADYNNNAYRNTVNVNTRFFTSFSETAMVVVSGWNHNISIKFHPVKGVSDRGTRQYATTNSETTIVTITPEIAFSLIDGFDNVIFPAIKEGRDACIKAITGNGDNKKLFSIYTNNNGTEAYFAVSSGDGVESYEGNSDNTLIHKLGTKIYKKIDNEDKLVTIQSDLIHFYNKLKNIDSISSSIAHGILYTNKLKDSIKNVYDNNGSYNSPAVMGDPMVVDNMGDFIPYN